MKSILFFLAGLFIYSTSNCQSYITVFENDSLKLTQLVDSSDYDKSYTNSILFLVEKRSNAIRIVAEEQEYSTKMKIDSIYVPNSKKDNLLVIEYTLISRDIFTDSIKSIKKTNKHHLNTEYSNYKIHLKIDSFILVQLFNSFNKDSTLNDSRLILLNTQKNNFNILMCDIEEESKMIVDSCFFRKTKRTNELIVKTTTITPRGILGEHGEFNRTIKQCSIWDLKTFNKLFNTITSYRYSDDYWSMIDNEDHTDFIYVAEELNCTYEKEIHLDKKNIKTRITYNKCVLKTQKGDSITTQMLSIFDIPKLQGLLNESGTYNYLGANYIIKK
jgi:hypothetical protein